MANYYRNPNHWRRTNAPSRTAGGPGKIMTARYQGNCVDCGSVIVAGATMLYDGATHCADRAACAAAVTARDAQRHALAATLVSNGGQANTFAAAAGSAFRGPQPAVNVDAIRAFIQAAKDRGLTAPRLRVLGPDGQTEMTLSLTTSGRAPGSVAVKLAGEYIGTVTPQGVAYRLTPEMQAHLAAVAQAPADAAKRYSVLKCRCSFCSLALTDEGSVEVGYGPTCAKHWGLPHKPKGTPAPAALAAPRDPGGPLGTYPALDAYDVEADERAMQAIEAAGDRAQTARETFHTMQEVA